MAMNFTKFGMALHNICSLPLEDYTITVIKSRLEKIHSPELDRQKVLFV